MTGVRAQVAVSTNLRIPNGSCFKSEQDIGYPEDTEIDDVDHPTLCQRGHRRKEGCAYFNYDSIRKQYWLLSDALKETAELISQKACEQKCHDVQAGATGRPGLR